MTEFLDDLRLNVRLADLLDVVVVTLMLYVGLAWLRRRAARAVLVGLVLVSVLYAIARLLEMYLVLAIFQAGFTLLLFSLVVVYREDIRHGLERLTFGWPFGKSTAMGPSDEFRQTLAESVMTLAERSIGALVVLRGRHSLEHHIRGGVPLDARLSMPLLLSIFHHETPGHDGAVIVQDEQLVSLGAHLPLSTNLDEVGPGGTRHTAALGLSERCDALVICVSEERGTVSIASAGRLQPIGGAPELEQRLRDFYESERDLSPEAGGRRLAGPLLSFAGCLVVASLLWSAFAFKVEMVRRVFADVPVEIRKLPPDWTLDSVEPSKVSVTLAGPERAIDTIDPATLKVSLDLSKPESGDVAVTGETLRLPEKVDLLTSSSPTIRIATSRVERATLPIVVTRVGSAPAGRRVVNVTTDPAAVPVLISRASLDWNRELATEPVDVAEAGTKEVGLVLPTGVRLVNPGDAAVEVTVEHGDAEPKPGNGP